MAWEYLNPDRRRTVANESTPKPSCVHCGTTRRVFELLGVFQCWTCYSSRTAAQVAIADASANPAPAAGGPAATHPDCTAPDCDCEPGIECAARGAARGVQEGSQPEGGNG